MVEFTTIFVERAITEFRMVLQKNSEEKRQSGSKTTRFFFFILNRPPSSQDRKSERRTTSHHRRIPPPGSPPIPEWELNANKIILFSVPCDFSTNSQFQRSFGLSAFHRDISLRLCVYFSHIESGSISTRNSIWPNRYF